MEGLNRQVSDVRVARLEVRLIHEMDVHRARGLSALPDGPDDERLAAAAVARGEHAGLAGREIARISCNISARVQRNAEILEQRCRWRACEAHREQNEIGGNFERTAGDLLDRCASRRVALAELDPYGV